MVEFVDAPSTSERRLVDLMRDATAILVAALVSGFVVGGVGSRVFMLVARLLAPERRRAITEAGARVGEVTFEGTFFLVLFVGLFTAIAVGVTLAVVQPWMAWTGKAFGVAFGAILLVLFSPTILDPDNFDFALLGDQAVTVAMIVVMFLLAGVLAVFVRDRMLARLPAYETISGKGAAYVPAAALGAVGIVLLIVLIGAPSDDGLSDVTVAVLAFIGLIGVTVTDRVIWVAKGVVSPQWVRIAGYGMLCIVFVLGSVQTISDITAILP